MQGMLVRSEKKHVLCTKRRRTTASSKSTTREKETHLLAPTKQPLPARRLLVLIVSLLLDVVLAHDGQEHLVQRRGADGVVLDAEVLVLLEHDHQLADGALRAATAGGGLAFPRDLVALPTLCRPLLLARHHAGRYREPQLSVVDLLLDLCARKGLDDPVSHALSVGVRRAGRALEYDVNMEEVAEAVSKVVCRAHCKHCCCFEFGLVRVT